MGKRGQSIKQPPLCAQNYRKCFFFIYLAVRTSLTISDQFLCFSFRSGMLESGVDRIITQVVDPKMNHTFRPQIETAIHEFLSLDRKEDNTSSLNPVLSEQTETQEPPGVSGPKTP
ncbi:hypothetical protein CHARACLAT_014556 [Characodon lateralis]|uniref:Uncharacterized protein n=1 Tax=Characodon lateralis TaxID=208331 RepID=A0ABU7D9N7_9TELE|nr:hypothetical protein [Characodon lateralis]